ncbi:MAG: glycosyltransferase family 4 protein [Candidatus Bathyarchaeia archaeon]
MKKPTVMIIKSSPWRDSHLNRNHPEYAAIFKLIQGYRKKVNFVLVGTTTKFSSEFVLSEDILAVDIRAGAALSYLTYQLELIRLHLKHRPNLTIVLGDQLLPVAFFSKISNNFKFVPIIIGGFNYYGEKTYGKILSNVYLKFSSFFLRFSRRSILKAFALSYYSRDGFVRLVPALDGQVSLISYPLSINFYAKAQQSVLDFPKSPTILTIAGIEPRKGLETLIRAIALVQPRPKVIIKGGIRNPAYFRKLKDLVKLLEVDDKVTFVTDRIGYDELVEYYTSATLFVLPTREDSLGVVLLEALHLNIPVIATCVGGIPDMIEHGVNGFLVKPDDPIELSKAITLLLQDSSLRGTLARNARSVLTKRYYQDRITLEDALFQSVAMLFVK